MIVGDSRVGEPSAASQQLYRVVSLKLSRAKQWALPLVILTLALGVRVWGLAGFLTADEPLWIDRARHFTGGLLLADYGCPPTDRGRAFAATGWACTLQTEHPGVTTMWGGSLGLLLYYWQEVRPQGIDLSSFLASIDMGNLDPALVAPVRLPLAVIAGVFVALFYVLLRRLVAEPVALAAALLVAFNPFHLALSRVLHHDALNTTFMVLAALALIGYWLAGWRWYWLLFAGIMTGLALLSKPASWFLLPYAALLALLSLYFQGASWASVQRTLVAGLGWTVVAALTYVTLFPAVWVIPAEVLRVVFTQSIEAAEEGHGLYFLGRVSDDPGLWFYPLSWLLQSTPLEVVGLLALPFLAFKRSNIQTLRLRSGRAFKCSTVEVALALFVGFFLIFATLSAKKLARYFLPAFPFIDIFVVFGLLWLFERAWSSQSLIISSQKESFSSGGVPQASADSSKIPYTLRFPLSALRSPHPAPRLITAALTAVILLAHGLPTLAHYPYYFTYYNPLLGGAAGAASMTTVGFGEGADQAAAYLNRLPNADALNVAVCGNDDLFTPFFRGKVHHCNEAEIMQEDYVVYYLKTVQLQRDQTTWRYFANHYPAVQRVTLANLDYFFIYRSPVEHPVATGDNSLPDMLTTFGYNLEENGELRLFWQNFGLGDRQLWVGLKPPAAANSATEWLVCEPAAGFAAEMSTPGAIIESLCPLKPATALTPGLYDVQLGLGHAGAVTALNSSALALLSFDSKGQISSVDREQALDTLVRQLLPTQATPLEIAYGDRLRLVGYQLEPDSWQPAQAGQVVLYWQPVRQPDFGLAQAVQVVLRLSAAEGGQPLWTATQPMLPAAIQLAEWTRGAVMPVRYPVAVPAPLQPGQYLLHVCLALTGSEQLLPGTPSGSSQPVECLPLTVRVVG